MLQTVTQPQQHTHAHQQTHTAATVDNTATNRPNSYTTPVKHLSPIKPYCSWCGDLCSRWSSVKRHAKSCVGNPRDGSKNTLGKRHYNMETPHTYSDSALNTSTHSVTHNTKSLMSQKIQSPISLNESGNNSDTCKINKVKATLDNTAYKKAGSTSATRRGRGRPSNNDRLLMCKLPGIKMQLKQKVRYYYY